MKNHTIPQLIDIYTNENSDLHDVVLAGEELARRGIYNY